MLRLRQGFDLDLDDVPNIDEVGAHRRRFCMNCVGRTTTWGTPFSCR
jgi:hypothetical protein